jgi:hypothetical protein
LIAAALANHQRIGNQRKPSYIQMVDVEPEPMPAFKDVQEVQVEPDEEITLVRPPKSRRIRVSLDRTPVQRPNLFTARNTSAYARQQREFVPTLLGAGSEVTPAVAISNDSMFSAYYSGPSRSGVSHRSTFIAVGIFGLTALLLFGNDSVTKYFQTWTAADSVASTSSRGTQPSAQPVVSETKLRTGKKTDRSIAPSRNIAAGSSNASGSRTKLTASVKPVANDKGQRAKDKQSESSGPTRPRVVKEPRR